MFGFIALLFVLVSVFNKQPLIVSGNGSDSEGNYSTSTRQFNGTALGILTSLKSGGSTLAKAPGILTSVIITGAGAGQINFFNATTSDINKRTNNLATATIFMATIPASAAAGDYQLDASFDTGLLMEIIGTAPTSTIVWK